MYALNVSCILMAQLHSCSREALLEALKHVRSSASLFEERGTNDKQFDRLLQNMQQVYKSRFSDIMTCRDLRRFHVGKIYFRFKGNP